MLSPEQLKARASGIGGSDMASILGENQYRSEIDVWLEKRHLLGLEIPCAPPAPFDGNFRTEFGNILEPVVADYYGKETGLRLVEPTTTFRHPDRSWHIGTPDRLCYSDEPLANFSVLDAVGGDALTIPVPDKILEVKTHGMMGGKAYDLEASEVPEKFRIQVAWYMALIGVKEADLAALFDSHEYRVFHIPHDQAVEDYLLEEGELFWNKVKNGVEPSPDGTKGFGEYLKGRFQKHVEDMVDMPIEVAVHIADYKAHRADKKAADGKMELAKQEIQLAIGHHQGLLRPDGKPAVTWKRKSVGTTSYGKMALHLRDRCGLTDSEYEEVKGEFTGEPARDFRVK